MKDRLRERRKELGLTLQDVADKTHSSKSYIWELERSDIRKPSALKLNAISLALETTSEYLLNGTKNKDEDSFINLLYRKLNKTNKQLLIRVAKSLINDQKLQKELKFLLKEEV